MCVGFLLGFMIAVIATNSVSRGIIAKDICRSLVDSQIVSSPAAYDYSQSTGAFTCWEGSEAVFVKAKDLTIREKPPVKTVTPVCEPVDGE